jgi:hypothetical protein
LTPILFYKRGCIPQHAEKNDWMLFDKSRNLLVFNRHDRMNIFITGRKASNSHSVTVAITTDQSTIKFQLSDRCFDFATAKTYGKNSRLSTFGVKRTRRLHCEMSAFDPKRTFASEAF